MYCKFCGEIIDDDCVVCPKCGKQVALLKAEKDDRPIYINNSASSSAAASVTGKVRKLPWYLHTFWILVFGLASGGIYLVIGIILRIIWKSHN